MSVRTPAGDQRNVVRLMVPARLARFECAISGLVRPGRDGIGFGNFGPALIS
jgi:hypothetical protein